MWSCLLNVPALFVIKDSQCITHQVNDLVRLVSPLRWCWRSCNPTIILKIVTWELTKSHHVKRLMWNVVFPIRKKAGALRRQLHPEHSPLQDNSSVADTSKLSYIWLKLVWWHMARNFWSVTELNIIVMDFSHFCMFCRVCWETAKFRNPNFLNPPILRKLKFQFRNNSGLNVPKWDLQVLCDPAEATGMHVMWFSLFML